MVTDEFTTEKLLDLEQRLAKMEQLLNRINNQLEALLTYLPRLKHG